MWMRDVSLAELTRWKIGGIAPALARAHSDSELCELLSEVSDQPVRALGKGANLLIADEGPGCAVIVLEGEFKRYELLADTIRCGAGAPISSVVQTARRAAREGLWILEAVPGSIGGALRMNAGTAESGLWDLVLWAEAMWPDGRRKKLTRDDVRPRYRGIDLAPQAVFLWAEIAAPPGDAERIEREHRQRREAKLEAQVYDLPTCGSTWKNPAPPAPPAWKLIDRVGMRGARRGDAQVSTKHANFIVNLGKARARDVVELMAETRRRVLRETGIALEPEIQFWGFSEDVLQALGALS